jgi:wobble nucleotide-excising tRNase
VKNWFHHLPGQRKRQIDDRPARFFLLRPRRHADGSRTSELGCLDPLLEEHESEYQYLFKRVYQEASRNDVVELEHHYGLPNVARRLLEAFLAFRFPEMSGKLYRRLERVSFDNAKKTRILRLLNTYSHAEAISDPGHDLSLLAETQPVLRDLLELMEAVDKEHYDGLIKAVTRSSAEEQGEA